MTLPAAFSRGGVFALTVRCTKIHFHCFRNHRQFIDTAKEISYLKAEMYTLSHLLSEQKSILAEQISTDIFERPKGLPVQIDPEVEAYEVKKKHFLDNIKVRDIACRTFFFGSS